AFLLNLGLETLHLRMPRHSENALAVARFLRESSRVAWVNYPGLEGDSQYSAAQKYLPNGAAGVVSFGIRGGRGAAVRFLDSLELVALVVHVCDARTSALHPASTTHRQLSDKQLEDCGITPDFIRLSVGIESANDIIADIAQALEKSRVEQRRERHAD
ncbi:MAG TPA: O-acetylhomoserine aminocarboxypropyltransferase/cysteine synthase, partial [Clostridiales bacterium]|nr:O-acetylhomoserine aminocarboxypropyltransferase/cysteine synthase [Clostridiales bacterium]